MQVLLVDKMTNRVDRCIVGLLEAGMQVVGSGSVAVADTCLKCNLVDLMVITAEAAGKGTRQLIRLAEMRNPDVTTILLAADVERASSIAAQSLPSVHYTLASDTSPDQILRFAMAALRPSPLTAELPPSFLAKVVDTFDVEDMAPEAPAPQRDVALEPIKAEPVAAAEQVGAPPAPQRQSIAVKATSAPPEPVSEVRPDPAPPPAQAGPEPQDPDPKQGSVVFTSSRKRAARAPTACAA